MASIGTDPGGRRRILFVAADGSRKTVRLGKCSQRDAEQVCRHVEALAAASIAAQPVTRETAVWVRGIGMTLHSRLARAALVEPRESPGRILLGAFIDSYIESRADLKPTTLTILKQSRIWLLRHLGEDRRLDRVTVADADAYRAFMVQSGLARATIAKRSRYARHFFEVAKRRGLIESNPFAHLKGAVKGDPGRRCFVPGDVVAKVMDAAPDAEWKLLLALARWGGLRIPSEALALTWHDVDFEHKRFLVRASKTEHHEDGGVRVVPMFPELTPHFQQVFDEAEEGAVHVITRYRSPATNLRTQLQRYIHRAGVSPWPKLWQNLRASRATELADTFPSHVCAAWLRHTEAIADEFYRTVTDQHFERAVADAPEAAQNPAQQPPVMGRNGPERRSGASQEPPELQTVASSCEEFLDDLVGVTGLEPVTSSV
jgi:integrase